MKKILIVFTFLMLLILCSCNSKFEGVAYSNSLLSTHPIAFESSLEITPCVFSAETDLPNGIRVSDCVKDTTKVLYPVFDNNSANTYIKNCLDNYFKDREFSTDTVFDFFISEGQSCFSIVFYDSSSSAASMRNIFALTITDNCEDVVEITHFIKSKNPFEHICETVDKIYGNEGAFQNPTLPEFYVNKQGIVVIDCLGQKYTIPAENFKTPASRKVTVGNNYKPVINNNEKVIALTFDDGPNYKTTSSLLSMLKEKNVKVTFFAVGYNIPGNEFLLRRMLEQGCDVGIHSYAHADFYSMTHNEIIEDIQKCADLIKSATDISPHLVRAPFGNIPDEIVKEQEYYYVNWSIDPVDWKAKTPEEIAEHVYEHATSGSIVLLHDIHQISCDATEIIIDRLMEDGWRFVTVSELFNMKKNPPSGEIYYKLR